MEQAVIPAKFSAQPVIQTSNKPLVGFTDLKIKSQFLLQNNVPTGQTIVIEADVVNDPQETIDIEITTERALGAVKQYAEEKAVRVINNYTLH